MRLHGNILASTAFSPGQKERLFSLMTAHYENIRKEKFLRDLSEKERVLVLYDDEQQIQGFTTFMIIKSTFRGKSVAALYSGDTIVARQFWGQLELFRVFGGLFSQLLHEQQEPLYWFLLSKGIKTYLLLPLFFHSFFPQYASPTPVYEQDLLDQLASQKFGTCYVQNRGIVRFSPRADRLKDELAEIPENNRLKPHVRFFLERNPGYVNGDELVCLARIAMPNFTRPALRFVNPKIS